MQSSTHHYNLGAASGLEREENKQKPSLSAIAANRIHASFRKNTSQFQPVAPKSKFHPRTVHHSQGCYEFHRQAENQSMNDHHRLSPAERSEKGLSLNRVAPYVIGAVLPLPVFMIVAFVISEILHVSISGFYSLLIWITTISIGLVCSVQSVRLAPNISIGLIGIIFTIVYALGIVLLGFLLRF